MRPGECRHCPGNVIVVPYTLGNVENVHVRRPLAREAECSYSALIRIEYNERIVLLRADKKFNDLRIYI